MNNTELKPCPFCGGKAVIEKVAMKYPNYLARCTECRIQTAWFAKRSMLVEYWNRRNNK